MKNSIRSLCTFVLFAAIVNGQTPAPLNYQVNIQPGSPLGYYYVTPFSAGNGVTQTMLMDQRGRLLYYRQFNSLTADFKMQPDGRLTYFYRDKFYVMNALMQVTDSVVVPAPYA